MPAIVLCIQLTPVLGSIVLNDCGLPKSNFSNSSFISDHYVSKKQIEKVCYVWKAVPRTYIFYSAQESRLDEQCAVAAAY